MSNMYLVINLDRCWGCKGCQVACKMEHGYSPKDFNPIQVIRLEQIIDNNVVCDFVPGTCMHCDHPKCLNACPKKAIFRDEEGLIQIHHKLCIGCGLCAKACPYGAIGLTSEKTNRKALKCDMCKERRARGYMTSCEQHCLGGAITSTPEEQLEEIVSCFPYRWSVGKSVYVSTKLPDLGKQVNSNQ